MGECRTMLFIRGDVAAELNWDQVSKIREEIVEIVRDAIESMRE
jgi:hypothetical protein